MEDESTAYRLGLGELTTEENKTKYARWVFMNMAFRVYPAMVDELATIAEGFDSLDALGGFEMLDPHAPERSAIRAYCQRWHLTKGRTVPSWALDLVAGTAATWQRHPVNRGMCYSSFGYVGLDPERARLSNGRTFDPMFTTIRAAKQRSPRRDHSKLSAIVEDAVDAAGGERVKSPRRREPKHFEAYVRHQIGGEPFPAIAQALYPRVCRTDDDAYFQGEALRVEVSKLRELIGLSRAPGRPRRPAR